MLTNKEFIKCFEEGTIKVAEFISWLADYKTQLEMISDITRDNADPECCVADALEKLAILLSTLVIYKDEYTKEPWKNTNEHK